MEMVRQKDNRDCSVMAVVSDLSHDSPKQFSGRRLIEKTMALISDDGEKERSARLIPASIFCHRMMQIKPARAL
jgi:hypothetical protein